MDINTIKRLREDRISTVKLYLGDCLDTLKQLQDKSMDLILTDPPYGIDVIKKTFQHKDSKPGRCLAHKTYWQDPGWDKKAIGIEYFEEMLRIGKNLILWGGQYYLDFLGNANCWIIWDKKNDGVDQANFEMAWTTFKTSNRIFRWLWRGMLQEDMKNKEVKYHPTMKPLALMKFCVEKYTEQGMTVLDPFMGSGTTGVACKELNRNFVGCEIAKEYYDVAERRIYGGTNNV